MARGWESKSVEQQQTEKAEAIAKSRAASLTPEQAARSREAAGLHLARQRVLQQIERCGNPRYLKLLQASLSDLDEKIRRLGG
jgi:hypothetical protein